MQLKDICVLDVATCDRHATVLAAAKTMREHHTGDLIVIDKDDDNRVPVGIVTDRDIVIDVLGKGLDPAKKQVADIMSSNLVIAERHESVTDALSRMREHGVRRIPVVGDRGALVGIVTLDDIIKLHAEESASIGAVVAKEMTREVRSKR